MAAMIYCRIFIGCIVVLFASEFSNSCNVELETSKDSIIFPLQQQQMDARKVANWWGTVKSDECMIRRRLWQKMTMELTFMNMDLTNEGLKVYTNKKHKRNTWKLLQKINSNEKNYKLSFTKQKAMKIVVDKASKFEIKYEPAYCPVPEGVESEFCVNKKAKFSTCGFFCKLPNFIPVDPKKPRYLAKCRKNRKWSSGPDTNCISLEDVITQCLLLSSITDNCKFNISQLLSFFPEQNIERQLPLFLLISIAETTMDNHNDVDWRLEKTKGVHRYLDPTHNCYMYCLRDKKTDDHLIQCFNSELNASQQMMCLRCRWVYKICENNKVFA